MSYGVGHRRSSDPELLCLWQRPATVAPTGSIAWELPYATGVAQRKKKEIYQHKPPQYWGTKTKTVNDDLLEAQCGKA